MSRCTQTRIMTFLVTPEGVHPNRLRVNPEQYLSDSLVVLQFLPFLNYARIRRHGNNKCSNECTNNVDIRNPSVKEMYLARNESWFLQRSASLKRQITTCPITWRSHRYNHKWIFDNDAVEVPAQKLVLRCMWWTHIWENTIDRLHPVSPVCSHLKVRPNDL